MPAFDKSLIDDHEQKYCNSCVSSGVEMIVKSLQDLPVDNYDLQNRWQNDRCGFGDFDGEVVSEVRFKREFGQSRGSSFPLDGLFRRVDEELASGRFVAVATLAREFHVWIVYDKTPGGYRAFTKASPPDGKQTIETSDIKSEVEAIGGTDILTYTHSENKWCDGRELRQREGGSVGRGRRAGGRRLPSPPSVRRIK